MIPELGSIPLLPTLPAKGKQSWQAGRRHWHSITVALSLTATAQQQNASLPASLAPSAVVPAV